MELQEIKNYLKVDFDDDDGYITLLIEVAQDYIKDSIGTYNNLNARHKLLLLNIVASLYENRQITIDKSNDKMQYTLRSIITQLQLDEVL